MDHPVYCERRVCLMGKHPSRLPQSVACDTVRPQPNSLHRRRSIHSSLLHGFCPARGGDQAGTEHWMLLGCVCVPTIWSFPLIQNHFLLLSRCRASAAVSIHSPNIVHSLFPDFRTQVSQARCSPGLVAKPPTEAILCCDHDHQPHCWKPSDPPSPVFKVGLGLSYALTITRTLSVGVRSSTALENQFNSVERVQEFIGLTQEEDDSNEVQNGGAVAAIVRESSLLRNFVFVGLLVVTACVNLARSLLQKRRSSRFQFTALGQGGTCSGPPLLRERIRQDTTNHLISSTLSVM